MTKVKEKASVGFRVQDSEDFRQERAFVAVTESRLVAQVGTGVEGNIATKAFSAQAERVGEICDGGHWEQY